MRSLSTLMAHTRNCPFSNKKSKDFLKINGNAKSERLTFRKPAMIRNGKRAHVTEFRNSPLGTLNHEEHQTTRSTTPVGTLDH